MADSNTTKRALAAALKELMEEVPFDRIQVTKICERCTMNRKSFYYHFKDKYDLVNWIFDTEIISFVQCHPEPQELDWRIEEMREVCGRFYENRNFYRKAMKIKGQNSFSEHLREGLMSIMSSGRSGCLPCNDADDFERNFFADAAVCAIERWLSDKNCMPPDVFVDKLMHLVRQSTEALYNELNPGE